MAYPPGERDPPQREGGQAEDGARMAAVVGEGAASSGPCASQSHVAAPSQWVIGAVMGGLAANRRR